MQKKFFFLYFFVLFLIFLVLFTRPITALNEDLGRHILLGKIITETVHVPTSNLLSYTYPDHPFVNTTWLSAVIFFWIVKFGGFTVLQIVSCIVVGSAVYIQLQFVRKRFSVVSIAIVSLVYLLLLSFRSDIRPEIFSMVFISVFITTLYEFFEHTSKKILLLVPLQILWVNLQIYFIAGPLLFFIFFLNSIFYHKPIHKYFIAAFLGVVLATFINPHTIYGAVFPFIFSRNYGFPVLENQNVITVSQVFPGYGALFPFCVNLFFISLLIYKRKSVSLVDWMIFGVFSLSMYINFRNITLFIFTTFIVSVSLADYFLKKNRFIIVIVKKNLAIFSLFSFVILCVILLKSIDVYGFGFGKREYWKKSVNFLIDNSLTDTLYNDYNVSGYLSYRIYPKKVFIDGRPEAYPENFFHDVYIPLQYDPKRFEKLDEHYHFTAILISHFNNTSHENKLLEYLINSKKFKIVYLDEYAVIFLKNSEVNKKLISKNKISLHSYPLDHTASSVTLFHYYLFFKKVHMDSDANRILEYIKRQKK